MSSLLTTKYIANDAGLHRSKKRKIAWICDPFLVEHEFNEGNVIFKVTFKTLTGDKHFDWDFDSLLRMSTGTEFLRVLLSHGIRVKTKSTDLIDILMLIQKPETIFYQMPCLTLKPEYHNAH